MIFSIYMIKWMKYMAALSDPTGYAPEAEAERVCQEKKGAALTGSVGVGLSQGEAVGESGQEIEEPVTVIVEDVGVDELPADRDPFP